MMLLAFAFLYSGFTSICLAKSRHWQQVFPAQTLMVAAPIRKALQITGWLQLLLGAACCVQAQGFATGSVLLWGLVSTAALLLIMLLPYAPRFAAGFAVAAPPLSALVNVAL